MCLCFCKMMKVWEQERRVSEEFVFADLGMCQPKQLCSMWSCEMFSTQVNVIYSLRKIKRYNANGYPDILTGWDQCHTISKDSCLSQLNLIPLTAKSIAHQPWESPALAVGFRKRAHTYLECREPHRSAKLHVQSAPVRLNKGMEMTFPSLDHLHLHHPRVCSIQLTCLPLPNVEFPSSLPPSAQK